MSDLAAFPKSIVKYIRYDAPDATDWVLYGIAAFIAGAFVLVPIYAIATWVFNLKHNGEPRKPRDTDF
jgi:hypothetical protein